MELKQVEEQLEAVINRKLSVADEMKYCKNFAEVISTCPVAEDKKHFVRLLARLLYIVSIRQGTISDFKKSGHFEICCAMEPVCSAFMSKSPSKDNALIMLDVLLEATQLLESESNARNYCSSTIAMNWLRKNVFHVQDKEITQKASILLVNGLCDIWSEIRTPFVKFIGQFIQSCEISFTETLLRQIFDICSQKDVSWQSLEGCLAAICCIIEVVLPVSEQQNGNLSNIVHEKLFKIVWPYVTHPQSCVRERAVRTLTVYLVRAPKSDISQCLELLINNLKNGEGLCAEEIEGYFTACIEILKLLSCDVIDDMKYDWLSIVFGYLNHSALTVRQIAGTLLKLLIGKHASSSAYFHKALNSLVLPLEDVSRITWEDAEGRFMALDSVLRMLIANHWLYNFTSPVMASTRFSRSEPIGYENKHLHKDVNDDIAAELIQLAKKQNITKAKPKIGLLEKRRSNISFEILDNVKPISLLDLCVQHKEDFDLSSGKSSLRTILKSALHSVAENLNSNQWELRRISAHVLPYVGEAVRWYDMNLFWECIGELLDGSTDTSTFSSGRSAEEMAATLLLAAWLHQVDRICLQIQSGQLVSSVRLRDYILATKGIAVFVDKLAGFCSANILDRQSVTSARVLLQFLARVDDLKKLGASEAFDFENTLHKTFKIAALLIWTATGSVNLVEQAACLKKQRGIPEDDAVSKPKSPFLSFGNTASENRAMSINSVDAHATVAVIEQILPDYVNLLSQLVEEAAFQADKNLRLFQLRNDALLLAASTLTPLAYLISLYSFDTELLSYITDAISVIVILLFKSDSSFVQFQEEVLDSVAAFLEQLDYNIMCNLEMGRSSVKTQVNKHCSVSVHAAARVAFWSCRLLLKQMDSTFWVEKEVLAAKFCKIIVAVSHHILGLVAQDGPESDNEIAALKPSPIAAWNVVGSGEILRPTFLEDVRATGSEPRTVQSSQPDRTKPRGRFDDSNDDSSESFDDLDSDADTIELDDEVVEDDLDELVVELVTDVRSMIPLHTRATAIRDTLDKKDQELLEYLLL